MGVARVLAVGRQCGTVTVFLAVRIRNVTPPCFVADADVSVSFFYDANTSFLLSGGHFRGEEGALSCLLSDMAYRGTIVGGAVSLRRMGDSDNFGGRRSCREKAPSAVGSRGLPLSSTWNIGCCISADRNSPSIQYPTATRSILPGTSFRITQQPFAGFYSRL